MFSKQLTTRLKEEQEKENALNQNAQMNVAQCDRIIRTVSCRHETNHSIKKSNINVLQSFDDIKLYVAPKTFKSNLNKTMPNTQQNDDKNSKTIKTDETTATTTLSSESNQNAQTNSITQNSLSYPNSTKLPRRNESMRATANVNDNNQVSEISEIDFKEILDQIFDIISTLNVNEWFKFNSRNENQLNGLPKSPPTERYDDILQTPDSPISASSPPTEQMSLFDTIQLALNHIDFNLKRNSDFINELTKLLDTSRAIKQESQLKKVLKLLEEEKINSSSSTNNIPTSSVSQPASPKLSAPQTTDSDDSNKKQRGKYKSFKGFSTGFSSSSPKLKNKESATHSVPTIQYNGPQVATSAQTASPKPGFLAVSPQIKAQSTKDLASPSLSTQTNIELTFQRQLLLYNQHNEVNNSDYIELEFEIEKISYNLDKLTRNWSKLKSNSGTTSPSQVNEQLKFAVEFHSLINNLNSHAILNELEQTMFKLNWLITSKSGFSEPNWQTNVISLTPSTLDSFIGINLLKNYYKYVKYDFVSYKLFTRQLQLIQICAIILSIIHRILIFYKETITLSSINNLNPATQITDFTATAVPNQNSLLSFSFSADKYRPISWSANHVTLYNVQNMKQQQQQQTIQNANLDSNSNNIETLSPTRSASLRQNTNTIDKNRFLPNSSSREESMRQIKNNLFIEDLNEFVRISTNRLNIQANLANRTGYFYMVNQSTGLVMQAVDFTSAFTLKEQIEQNQKRLQNSSIKAGANRTTTITGGSTVTKGPRFYLMPKATSILKNSKQNSNNNNNASSSILIESANDEQLWYYYLINGCIANKVIRSGHCMAASSLNTKSPVCFWPNVKTTNCSWFFNSVEQTIVSGLSDDLVLDYIIIDEPPNQRYAVVIDNKVPNKASQKWSFEFC